LRRSDAIHLNLFAPRELASLVAFLAWPRPTVYVDHFSDLPRENEPRRFITRTMDQFTVRRIAKYVGVSDYVVRRAQSRFGLTGTSYQTILNGIDEQVFAAPPPPRDEQQLRVLAAAHLIPEKGVHRALDAVAGLIRDRIPVRLQVAGDGPQRASLERQAVELGIQSSVEFLGLRDDVPDLMRQAHVFVHPATLGEAFGFTVAEAMAAGCAVIASQVGGIPELLKHRETGLLVAPGSADAIIAAATEIFHDPDLRIRLGAAARDYALGHLGVTRCVAAHFDCIEAVAGH
jgi:glycosyltransferase involved in cell wall biosynthesis